MDEEEISATGCVLCCALCSCLCVTVDVHFHLQMDSCQPTQRYDLGLSEPSSLWALVSAWSLYAPWFCLCQGPLACQGCFLKMYGLLLEMAQACYLEANGACVLRLSTMVCHTFCPAPCPPMIHLPGYTVSTSGILAGAFPVLSGPRPKAAAHVSPCRWVRYVTWCLQNLKRFSRCCAVFFAVGGAISHPLLWTGRPGCLSLLNPLKTSLLWQALSLRGVSRPSSGMRVLPGPSPC